MSVGRATAHVLVATDDGVAEGVAFGVAAGVFAGVDESGDAG